MTKSFWVLWFSQVINRLGDGFYHIALSWLVYSLTGSALALGGLLSVYMAAVALAQALGGPLTDRLNRRRLMIGLDLVRGAVMLAPFLLWRAGLLQAWHVYVVFVASGILSTPYGPASGALLPRLVERKALARANAWLSGAMEAMYLLGPAVAGVFITYFGAPQALLVDAASFWLSSLLISFLRVEAGPDETALAAPVRAGEAADGYWATLRTGWRILVSDRMLGAAAVVKATLALSDTAFVVLLVPYVQDVLQSGAAGAGMLEASLSGGIMLAALVAVRRYWDRHPSQVWGLAPIFCLATAALALTPSLAWAVTLQVLGGLAVGVFNIRVQTLFQQTVDDQRLGSTLALRNALGSATQAGGAVVAGGVAAAAGASAAFLAFGLAGAAVGLLVIGYMRYSGVDWGMG